MSLRESVAPVQPKYHSQYISQVPGPSCVKVLVQNGMGPLAVTRCRACAQSLLTADSVRVKLPPVYRDELYNFYHLYYVLLFT